MALLVIIFVVYFDDKSISGQNLKKRYSLFVFSRRSVVLSSTLCVFFVYLSEIEDIYIYGTCLCYRSVYEGDHIAHGREIIHFSLFPAQNLSFFTVRN